MTLRRRVLVVAGSLLTILVSACALFVLAQPTSYSIARTRMMRASPECVRRHLGDIREFWAWQPWTPRMSAVPVVSFSPTSEGEGAWVERRVPDETARTTIVSVASDRVEMRNDFHGAHTGGTSRTVFRLVAVEAGTEVTWATEGDLDLLRRALWPFVALESRIAPDMEAGLGRLEASCVQ